MTYLRLYETPKLGVHQTGGSSSKRVAPRFKLSVQPLRIDLVQIADPRQCAGSRKVL
jgi:hypothetical protein